MFNFPHWQSVPAGSSPCRLYRSLCGAARQSSPSPRTHHTTMLHLDTLHSHAPFYTPPSKRKREEEEESPSSSPDHRVPTMDTTKEVAEILRPDLPFSSLMRRMAAKYQAPTISPPHLHLPLLSSPLHLSSHPYSHLMASLASARSSPSPPLKRRREEGPIDLSSTGDSEELDVVSVEDDKEQEEMKERQEMQERQENLQRLLAAALFHRGESVPVPVIL